MNLAFNRPMLSWWSLRQPASWPTRPLATLNERLLRDIGLQGADCDTLRGLDVRRAEDRLEMRLLIPRSVF